jgi:hypothetical protein
MRASASHSSPASMRVTLPSASAAWRTGSAVASAAPSASPSGTTATPNSPAASRASAPAWPAGTAARSTCSGRAAMCTASGPVRAAMTGGWASAPTGAKAPRIASSRSSSRGAREWLGASSTGTPGCSIGATRRSTGPRAWGGTLTITASAPSSARPTSTATSTRAIPAMTPSARSVAPMPCVPLPRGDQSTAEWPRLTASAAAAGPTAPAPRTARRIRRGGSRAARRVRRQPVRGAGWVTSSGFRSCPHPAAPARGRQRASAADAIHRNVAHVSLPCRRARS